MHSKKERNESVLRSLFANGMFSWLDLILLGWTLGLAWLALCAFLSGGSLRERAGSALASERFLFGDWAASARQEAGGWLFLAAVVLLQFDMFFMNSLVRESGAAWHSFLASKLEIIYFAAIVLKLVFFTRYSGRQLAAGYCFFFVFRWVFINNHNFWMITGVLFALAAKDVPLRRTLKAGLAVSTASFGAVVLGSMLGWVNTLQIDAGGETSRLRDSFGYGWFNLTGAILLGLCVMYLCWRQVKNLKWFDFALLAAVMVFCDQGPDSRAATVCIALLIVLSAVLRFAPGLAKPLWVRAMVCAVPAACFAAIQALGWAFSFEDPVLNKLDQLLNGRLHFAHEIFTQTDIAIAGQGLWDRQYTVDNLYANLWCYGGPVASVLFWGAVTVLLWRLMKKGAVTESVCLVALLAHAFMETHFIWPCINVCLWLLPCVLYLLAGDRTPSFAPEEKRT